MNDEKSILDAYFLPWISEGRKVWVAQHGQMGFVVYDPSDQSGVKSDHIKLFIVNQSRKSIFEKKFLLNYISQIDSSEMTNDTRKKQIKEAASVHRSFSLKEQEQIISDECHRRIDAIRKSLPFKKKYNELRLNYPDGQPPYAQLLETVEWSELRLRILEKYGCRCNGCGDNFVIQVHHLYYVMRKLPWDYPDEALVPLCIKCHSELHGAVYEEVNGELIERPNLRRCPKCSGTGYLPRFDYFENGKCFKCNGSGFVDIRYYK